MGRVTTEAAIENIEDLWAVKRGLLPADQARRVTISDALVDTGGHVAFVAHADHSTIGFKPDGVEARDE